MNFKECWQTDYYRNTAGSNYHFYNYFTMDKKLRLIYWLRKCQSSKGVVQKINRLIYKHYRGWNNNDIFWQTKIGKGLYLGHSGGRYINEHAVIGENCNINHNVTIGQENRGGRKGYPTIGNMVWIGCNSVIVGNIHIGNDVLITPNSFVNFDVPDHSLVINGQIKHKENATEYYINCIK